MKLTVPNLSIFLSITILVLTSCMPETETTTIGLSSNSNPEVEVVTPTPLPTRPVYSPGELVDYTAQTGDTLPALAVHFNTTESEIRSANPVLPDRVTTLPPGLPMKIPIYYEPFWGSQYQIIPDSLFINGPLQTGFNPVEFVNGQQGWLKHYQAYAGSRQRNGGELIAYIATNFSISPRLLLTLLEFQLSGLTNPTMPSDINEYPLGYKDIYHKGLYRQLVWAANILNNGYYGWRSGHLKEFEQNDGTLERPDPWQNAATVGLQYYFSKVMTKEEYEQAIHWNGFSNTYRELFGINTLENQPHIPGSLEQPNFSFPFQPGKAWAFTGGPHSGWGEGDPLAAVDFAPPAVVGGCSETDEMAAAIADGIVVRKDIAVAVLDLDGDSVEQTGWTIFYLHLATDSIPPEGTQLKAGDPIGRPSCEGGRATGTHIHIARKYNGEWIPAAGALPFNLEGWVAENGPIPYEGYLVRFGSKIRACVCSDKASQVMADTNR